MKRWWFPILCLCTILPAAAAGSVEKISLPPAIDMQRADLYRFKAAEQPVAVLVLCPGCNGNGESLLRQPAWQLFAREQKLDLIGLSFASEVSLLTSGRGYYYASQGSGQLLLDAVQKFYGKPMPLLFYGFSGGAHFTSRFVEWKPAQVTAWAAYSAAWWDTPQKAACMPPGLIACGDRDERYGASLVYFKQGRALGKPWLWIGLPNTGHATDHRLEEFIRHYLASLLGNAGATTPKPAGFWVDIDRKTEANPAWVQEQPSVTAWLPDAKLLSLWKEIHEP